MFKLKIGYLLTGIATGLVLLFSFLGSLPDGKLHLVFCDVGQGDAAYIRFPDGRDMLVDGGPNDKVLGCLGKHMPFWDRALDLVVLSHPQKDHMQGLLSVLERYKVGYLVRSDVANATEGYQKLIDLVRQRQIQEKFVTTGEQISVGQTKLTVLWPSNSEIALWKRSHLAASQGETLQGSVLGASSLNVNDASVVLWLRYGSFDTLLTGDADSRVESGYLGTSLADSTVEVLKVPHHGSKTGMSQEFLDWLYPSGSADGKTCCDFNHVTMQQCSNVSCSLAVISVGKNNTYGHPAGETMKRLRDREIKILRTDINGDIEVISDGKGWKWQ